MTDPIRKNSFLQAIVMIFLLPCFAWMPLTLQANPTDPNVISGEIEIEAFGDTLSILQESDRAIIEWGGFSIGAGELTEFLQPSSSAAALNRVTGGSASFIDGVLKANGGVWLINQNGIVVGPSGLVDTQSLVLSTLEVSDGDFLDGGLTTFSGGSINPLHNYGTIKTADGGNGYFVANTIINDGTISGGLDSRIVLVGANEAVIDEAAGLISVSNRVAGGLHPAVQNNGVIEGMDVAVAATGNVMATAIQNSGSIRANGVDTSGGRVRLTATVGSIVNTETGIVEANGANGGEVLIESGAGEIVIGGSIAANGVGGSGGSIEMDGSMISVQENASIAATGDLGGGRISIGSQGLDGDVQTSAVTLGAGSQINAGSVSGGGGEIIVQTSGLLMGRGGIDASGGTVGGSVSLTGDDVLLAETSTVGAIGGQDGGTINATAQSTLYIEGSMDASGTDGIGGTVNLNGDDILISQTGSVRADGGTSGGTVNASAADELYIAGIVSADSLDGDGGTINLEGEDITVAPTGKISADGGNNGGTINLSAVNEVLIFGDLSANGTEGTGGTIGVTGTDVFVAPTATISANGAIGGTVLLDATNDMRVAGQISATGSTGVGGLVGITGDSITLEPTANVDASGATGGGGVFVGGGFGGNDPRFRNASSVNIAPGATLSANATQSGDGGQIAMWSDGSMNFEGSANVAGAGAAGNGGFIEASGLDSVNFSSGQVNALGSGTGTTGTFLIDPTNVTLAAADAAGIAGQLAAANVVITTTSPGLDPGELGNVDIERNFNMVYDSANSFSIFAHNEINIGRGGGGGQVLIVNRNAGSVNLIAGWNGEGTPDVNSGTISAENIIGGLFGEWGGDGGNININADSFERVEVGSAGGETNLFADNINSFSANGNDENTHIGMQLRHNPTVPVTGDINVYAKGNMLFLNNNANARKEFQIGHGGDRAGNDQDVSGNITINAGGAIIGQAGRVESYLQFGHGGRGNNDNNNFFDGNMTGDINVTAGSILDLRGGLGNGNHDSWVKIGHGGRNVLGTASGDINVQATEITVNAGSRERSFAQIGHGGHRVFGDHNGIINVVATAGSIEMNAARLEENNNRTEAFAMIGHGGYNSASPDAHLDTLIMVRQVQATDGGGNAQWIIPDTQQITTDPTIIHGGTGAFVNGSTDLALLSIVGAEFQTYRIVEGTFSLTDNGTTYSDLNGDIIDDADSSVVGSIDYSTGQVTLTGTTYNGGDLAYRTPNQPKMGDFVYVPFTASGGIDGNRRQSTSDLLTTVDPTTGYIVNADGLVDREIDVIGTPRGYQTFSYTDGTTPLYVRPGATPADAEVMAFGDAETAFAAGFERFDGQALQQRDASGDLLFINDDGNISTFATLADVPAGYRALRHGLRGDINVDAQAGSVIMNAGAGERTFAQIGHGGHGEDARQPNNVAADRPRTAGEFFGNITVNAGAGDISFDRILDQTQNQNRGGGSYVQLGHGGREGHGSRFGTITATATGDVEMFAGRNQSHALLGHGGRTDTWTRDVDIDTNADGFRDDDNSSPLNDYDNDGVAERDQRVPWAGLNTLNGTLSGDITVNAGNDVTFRGGFGNDRDNNGGGWNGSFAQIGNGGYNVFALPGEGHNGDVTVTAGGDIDFVAGAAAELNPESADENLLRAGQTVREVNSNDAYVMIGNGGRTARGDHWGNITVAAGGDLRFQATGGWDAVGLQSNNSDFRNGEFRYNTSQSNSLTGDRNFAFIGNGGYESDHRSENRNGTRDLSGGISTGAGNLGESNINVTAGGDIHLIAAQKSQRADLSTALGVGLIPPNSTQVPTGAVTSQFGGFFIRGVDETIAGHDNNQDGLINAYELPDPVDNARQSFVQIGNGGFGFQIQSVNIADGHKGDVTVNAGGDINMVAGDFQRGVEPNSLTGGRAQPGRSFIGVATVASTETGDNYVQIGNGGRSSNTGALEGDITVTSTGGGLTMTGGIGVRDYVQIGHGGYHDQRGLYNDSRLNDLGSGGNGQDLRLVVDANNQVQLAYIVDPVTGQILRRSDGSAIELGDQLIAGNATVIDPTTSTEILDGNGNPIAVDQSLSVVSQRKDVNITGDVNVSVAGNIDMDGGQRVFAFSQVGHGGYGFAGRFDSNSVDDPYTIIDDADISLTTSTGDITIDGGAFAAYAEDGNANNQAADARWAMVGHGGYDGEFDITNSDIVVSTTDGNISVRAGQNRGDFAKIGHGGFAMNRRGRAQPTFGGNIDVMAGGYLEVLGGIAGTEADFAAVTDIDGNTAFVNLFYPSNWVNQFYSFAQIGHGGGLQIGNGIVNNSFTGNINVQTGTDDDPLVDLNAATESRVDVLGGDGFGNFAVIGHGGADLISANAADGNVTVNSGGAVNIKGGSRFQNGGVTSTDNLPGLNFSNHGQIGHSMLTSTGGTRNFDSSGDVTVTALADILLEAGGGNTSHAMIGNGGTFGANTGNPVGNDQTGDHTGDITVVTAGDLTLKGGDFGAADPLIGIVEGQAIDTKPGAALSFAQIGNGGAGVNSAAGGLTGDIDVRVGGNLVVESGTGGNAYSKIGHGDYLFTTTASSGRGFREGDVHVAVGESATITGGQIGHVDAATSTALALEGDTFIAVARNEGSVGTLTVESKAGVLFDETQSPVETSTFASSIVSSLVGELRFYVPERASLDFDNDLVNIARLNGRTYQIPGVPPLREDEQFESEFTFQIDPATGLPTGEFTPVGTFQPNGFGRYNIFFGAAAGGGGGGGGGGDQFPVDEGGADPFLPLEVLVPILAADPTFDPIAPALTPFQISLINLFNLNNPFKVSQDRFLELINDRISTTEPSMGGAYTVSFDEGEEGSIGSAQGREFKVFSLEELIELQGTFFPEDLSVEIVNDPFNLDSGNTEDEEEERRQRQDEQQAEPGEDDPEEDISESAIESEAPDMEEDVFNPFDQ